MTDIEERENKLWQRNASVHYAYLRLGDKSLAGEEDSAIDGEDGVKVFAFADSDPDPEKTLLSYIVPIDTLSVWFNREPNATDLHFDLNLITDFKEAWMSTAPCLREIAGFQN